MFTKTETTTTFPAQENNPAQETKHAAHDLGALCAMLRATGVSRFLLEFGPECACQAGQAEDAVGFRVQQSDDEEEENGDEARSP